MRHRSRLVGVIPASAGAFVVSSFVLTGVTSSVNGQGLAAVARITIGNLRGTVPQSPDVYLVLLACAAALFVSLAVYSVTAGSAFGGSLPSELTAGVVGVAALFGWVQLTSGLQPWESFGVPAAAIVGLAWVVSRER